MEASSGMDSDEVLQERGSFPEYELNDYKTYMESNRHVSKSHDLKSVSSLIYRRGRKDLMVVLQSTGDFYRWLYNGVEILMKRSQQTMISFILGVVLGVTLTALMFQQNMINGNSHSVRSDILGNGFIYGTLLPAPMSQVQEETHELLSQMNKDSLQPSRDFGDSENKVKYDGKVQKLEDEIHIGGKVCVGVITAEKFLSSRALAVNSTWGSQVDKISFFAERGTSEEYGIPVINLDGISDKEYPPQKKSFKMLKHMCENYIDEYDWFVRADDDVYIRVDKLRKFLAQIDSDKLIYMGQPGHGVPEVREKLGLNGHNFCMGGPGVLFNRKAMKKLCPHINNCMAEVVSGEEDVEIGRCVSNHLHIECTHAWETLKLFYHSYQEEYTEEKPFLGNLAENIHVDKAITLHHVKVPYIMYKIHRHFTSLLLNSSTQMIANLRKRAKAINELLPPAKHRQLATEKMPPRTREADSLSDVAAWKSFNVESIFGLSSSVPGHDITNDDLADLKQIGETAIDACIDRSASHLTYSHLSGGYFRTDPLRGTDYLLDIAFTSKEQGKPDEIKRVHLLRPLSDLQISNVQSVTKNSAVQNFYIVLPVHDCFASSFDAFMRKYYEKAILQRSSEGRKSMPVHVTLIVSLYDRSDEKCGGRDSSSPSVYDIASWYRVKYPQSKIEILSPPSEDNGAEATILNDINLAYARGILHAKKLRFNSAGADFVLLTSSNFSVSADLLTQCAARVSVIDADTSNGGERIVGRHRFYQPVPFVVYPAVSAASEVKNYFSQAKKDIGYWGTVEADSVRRLDHPVCTTFDAAISLAENSMSVSKSNLLTSLYDGAYDASHVILRIPDKNLIDVPGR